MSRWIPVRERLPGIDFIDACILVSIADETIPVRTCSGLNFGTGVYDFDNYSEALGKEAEFYPWSCIDAWMPLPEPYTEE